MSYNDRYEKGTVRVEVYCIEDRDFDCTGHHSLRATISHQFDRFGIGDDEDVENLINDLAMALVKFESLTWDDDWTNCSTPKERISETIE